MHRAEHIYSKEQVAVKVISKEKNQKEDDDIFGEAGDLEEKEKQAIENELRVLGLTNGVHGVIEFYEVFCFEYRGLSLTKIYTWCSSCFKEKSFFQ